MTAASIFVHAVCEEGGGDNSGAAPKASVTWASIGGYDAGRDDVPRRVASKLARLQQEDLEGLRRLQDWVSDYGPQVHLGRGIHQQHRNKASR